MQKGVLRLLRNTSATAPPENSMHYFTRASEAEVLHSVYQNLLGSSIRSPHGGGAMSHLLSPNIQWGDSRVYPLGWLSGDTYKQPEWKVTAGALWVWSTGRALVVHGGLWGHQIAECRLSVCMESGVLGSVCSLICLWGTMFSFQFPRCPSAPCTWLVRGLPSLNGPSVGGLEQL